MSFNKLKLNSIHIIIIIIISLNYCIKSLLLYHMEENNSLEKKRKKLTSSSIGNKYKFNQQKPKKPKKDNSIKLSAREYLRDIGIINDLDSLSHCCPIGGD